MSTTLNMPRPEIGSKVHISLLEGIATTQPDGTVSIEQTLYGFFSDIVFEKNGDIHGYILQREVVEDRESEYEVEEVVVGHVLTFVRFNAVATMTWIPEPEDEDEA